MDGRRASLDSFDSAFAPEPRGNSKRRGGRRRAGGAHHGGPAEAAGGGAYAHNYALPPPSSPSDAGTPPPRRLVTEASAESLSPQGRPRPTDDPARSYPIRQRYAQGEGWESDAADAAAKAAEPFVGALLGVGAAPVAERLCRTLAGVLRKQHAKWEAMREGHSEAEWTDEHEAEFARRVGGIALRLARVLRLPALGESALRLRRGRAGVGRGDGRGLVVVCGWCVQVRNVQQCATVCNSVQQCAWWP